ncbi:MAG: segregation/condensation protein A [Kiritimatiellae bacterium]|nr:segregation/condensation protein A [Kiritimatiellia bacterium]
MSESSEYKVRLEVFEGPLDLLLYLIKKEEVDIYHIPIERITTQYMEYLDLMQMLDLSIAGEFIVMAATLMMIKSRMLLPVEERPEMVDEEDEGDPRWDLVRQLVEYKKFKDAAQFLGRCEDRQSEVFGREGDLIRLGPAPEVLLQDVSLFDLIGAFSEALKRAEREDLREIFSERYTVGEKIDALMSQLRETPRMSLHRVFADMRSRHEIVVTFLAMLELIRLKHIVALQDAQFGEIVIERLAEA